MGTCVIFPRSTVHAVRQCGKELVDGPFLIIVAAVIVAIVLRWMHGGMDHDRIRQYVEARGGRLINASWVLFGPGSIGKGWNRIYEVRYLDKDGNRHHAYCKTSGWSGVYITRDSIEHHADSPEAAQLADPESLETMAETVGRLSAPQTSATAHEAGVPRRFGVGIMLVITTMYAVLFSVLETFGAHPVVFVAIAIFFTAVGLGQMLLFKGQHPRRASIIVGASLLGGLSILGGVFGVVIGGGWGIVGFLCCAIVLWVICGALFGYLAGGLIAGVFLVIDKLENARDKSRNRG